MEKIINRLINESLVNVDRYNNNNSTWLIFTETKQWVIELTKDGTLWYNYNFFKNLFVYMSMDVVENQHYITKWVEDTIISGVKSIKGEYYKEIQKVEYTIQNGVKEIELHKGVRPSSVEDTIQNGVKDTKWMSDWEGNKVEDAIQNGVKHIEPGGYLGSITMGGKLVHMVESPKQNEEVEDVIENGVKHTVCSSAPFVYSVKDTLQHGVIETFDETHHRRREVVRTIRDGIKETIL